MTLGIEDPAKTPRTETGVKVIEVTSVRAGYLRDVDILHGCSIHAMSGEIVGIIGSNGAGKSTLLRALIGLVDVRAGQILYNGMSVVGMKPEQLTKAGMSMVPQTKNVFPSLTVKENLEMGLYRSAARQRRFDVEKATELFPELRNMLKRRAGSLSGGERQLLAIARALVIEPDLLLLDEPSAGLSPVMQDAMFLRVHEIRKTGVTIVMVEQNAHRCLELSDHAYVLDQGLNAYEGPGSDLLGDERIIELYLGQ